MTKDRLPALRSTSKHRSISFDEDGFPNDQQGAVDFGYRVFMQCEYLNDFLADTNRMREDIDWMREKVEEVKKKHSIILSVPVIDERMRRELEDLTDSITKMAAKIKAKLKEFEIEVERSVKDNPTSAEVRIRRMQHETLSRLFVEVMVECNNAQAHHRERCKERYKRQLEITGNSTTDEELEEMLEHGTPPVLSVFNINVEVREAKTMLADIEARHQDILRLEKSIFELHSMFVDMAMLVASQGDLINRIDYNVLRSVDFVDKAKHQTKRALVYKTKIRWKRLILISVSAVIVIIIIISLATTLTKK